MPSPHLPTFPHLLTCPPVTWPPDPRQVTPLATPVIKRISCGPQHTVAVDVNNKAYRLV